MTTNQLPLEIALKEKQESIARTLVNHGCNINSPDHDGFTLLHRAVEHGDEFGAIFLIEHGANVKSVTIAERDTPLHLSAKYKLVSRNFHCYFFRNRIINHHCS